MIMHRTGGGGLSRLAALTGLLAISCATYESRQVAFKHPTSYANVQTVNGAQIAAEDFGDKKKAKGSFGFDILDAGLLPVQLVIDNTGSHPLQIVAEQTFLIDREGGMWNILAHQEAFNRLEKSTEYSRMVSAGGRTSVMGAAGGALIGAAIGVLSGRFSESTLKGAATGAAGGAFVGGAQELGGTQEGATRISKDLANRELKNKAIVPGTIGRGFMFFPAEAKTAAKLRLQIKEVDTGQTHTVIFDLP